VFFGLVSTLIFCIQNKSISNSFCYNRVLSVGVLNLNNMRDEASDGKVGKNTLVVKLAVKKAKLYPLF
jgi:1,4-dihydroxy-2-naphthoate octaprenyltransferase